jgi:hypothetical protein
LEDQLNKYRQQWQADQKNQIIAKMAGKMPGKTNEGNRKNSERNHHNSIGGRSSTSLGTVNRVLRVRSRSFYSANHPCVRSNNRVSVQFVPKRVRLSSSDKRGDTIISHFPIVLFQNDDSKNPAINSMRTRKLASFVISTTQLVTSGKRPYISGIAPFLVDR